MVTDLRFARGFTVKRLEELPNAATPRYFFPPIGSGGRDGELVLVQPIGAAAWIGQFGFGATDYSAIIAAREPGRLIVVARGEGYNVKVAEPSDWQHIAVTPIRGVHVLEVPPRVIFWDYTNLTAYGPSGLMWRSPRLCWDDLEVKSVSASRLEGRGSDPTDSITPMKRFAVDLESGTLLESEFDSRLW